MEINRNNYELFFLDYLDGKLEGGEIDRFLDFIEKNPDLKDELAGLENMKLSARETGFSNKNSLYRNESQQPEDENFTTVAYMEGDLSELDAKLFLKHLEFHPEQEKELELLMKTRLKADESIVFPAKRKLYRHGLSMQLVTWGIRIAAVLLLFFVLRTVFNSGTQEEQVSTSRELAQTHGQPIMEKEVSPAGEQQPVVMAAEKRKITASAKNETPTIFNTKKISVKTETEARHTLVPFEPLRTIQARLDPVQQIAKTELAVAKKPYEKENVAPEYYTVDSYLAEKVLKIKTRDKSLIESGFDLASNVSGNRFQYETEEGKISKINFDTRLLAFSIPVKK
ncbi:MAG: hypothetical protein RBS73_04470 [Prolixibacteraceae bacterium]|jgi:hypothetical protein|nr:hypothetical protein [Prolixibacteraceae bacterium]